MTVLARMLCSRGAGRPALLLGLTLSALWLVLSLPAVAGARVVEEAGVTKAGVQPREIARYWDGDAKFNGLVGSEEKGEGNHAAVQFNDLGGRPVMHSLVVLR